MQFAPNAIAILMAFLVICYRVGVEPTLQLFSHVVSVKTSRKDAHFFFMNLGEKLVNFPESNKHWKEKFVWVFGADPILACSTWPEIEKEALKPLPLSAEERQDLEKIRSYAGSRDISNLFDASSLRVAGLSHTQPTEADKERAAALARAGPKLPKDSKAKEPAKPATTQLPVKRVRPALSAKDAEFWKKNTDKMAAMLKSRSGAAEGPERKKKKVKKSAPKGDVEAVTIELDVPVPVEGRAQGAAPSSGLPTRSPAADEAPAIGDGAVPEQQTLETS